MSGPDRVKEYFRGRGDAEGDRPAPDAQARGEAPGEAEARLRAQFGRVELSIHGAVRCTCRCDCREKGVQVTTPHGAIFFGTRAALDVFVAGLREAGDLTWPGEGA